MKILKNLKALKEQIELDFSRKTCNAYKKLSGWFSERTKNIILDLKNFSRLDEMVVNNIDLKKEIDTTL